LFGYFNLLFNLYLKYQAKCQREGALDASGIFVLCQSRKRMAEMHTYRVIFARLMRNYSWKCQVA